MPNRMVSFGVLLFSFGVLLFGFKPKESGFDFSMDKQYYVPTVTVPVLVYWILGAIAIGMSLFFIIAASRRKWRESVEEFVNTKAYYPGFVVFWIVYIMGFLKGVAAVISVSPPAWVVYLVFYYGFILFLLIPVMYFKGLSESKK
jgi:hypothetical protein